MRRLAWPTVHGLTMKCLKCFWKESVNIITHCCSRLMLSMLHVSQPLKYLPYKILKQEIKIIRIHGQWVEDFFRCFICNIYFFKNEQ